MAPGIAWVCEKVSRQPNFAAIFPKIKFTAFMRKVEQAPIMHKVRFCSDHTHVRAIFATNMHKVSFYNNYAQGQFFLKVK